MERSPFQFTNPVLTRLEFTIHDDFEVADKLNMRIKVTPNISVIDKSDDKTANSASVSVTVSVGTQDSSTPFYIEAEEEAKFKWDNSIVDGDQIQLLLKQNAVALLLSYLRPIISSVTAASPYPAYNLPFINLTSEK